MPRKITDRNGNTLRFDYTSKPGSAQGALSKITDTRGRVVTAGWTYHTPTGKEMLTSLTDPTGRATAYGYDDDGSLTTATGTDGATTTYRYGDVLAYSQLLTGITDPRGHLTHEITYHSC